MLLVLGTDWPDMKEFSHRCLNFILANRILSVIQSVVLKLRSFLQPFAGIPPFIDANVRCEQIGRQYLLVTIFDHFLCKDASRSKVLRKKIFGPMKFEYDTAR